MATVPKEAVKMEAAVKVELKVEPKEQREQKKVSTEKTTKLTTNQEKVDTKSVKAPAPISKAVQKKVSPAKDSKPPDVPIHETKSATNIGSEEQKQSPEKNISVPILSMDLAHVKAELNNKLANEDKNTSKSNTMPSSKEKPVVQTKGNSNGSADSKDKLKDLSCGSGESKETPKETLTKISNQKIDSTTSSSETEKSEPTSAEPISTENTKPTETTQSKDENKTEEKSDKNNNDTEDKAKQNQSTKEQKEKKDKTITTKTQLRSETWNKMNRSSMLAFRRPCNYRIPHFKGDIIAAGRLTTMEVFQNAKVVKINLDKALESVRLQIVEARKEMIVGCPGLREAVFLHVKPPMEPSKSSNRLASSRIGIGHVGTALNFSAETQADLVIVGSVAVDRSGLRVGKGEGFADLEFALLKKLGGIVPNAPVITVVHDSQVYDSLPEELFKEHDVSADYIVTPTEVIEVNPKRKHPDFIWNILSNRRVNNIPIIKQLLDKEKNREGINISLKEEDTDSEELEQIASRKKFFRRRRTLSNGSQTGRRQYFGSPNNNGNNRNGRIRRHTAPSERGFKEIQQNPRPTRTFRNRMPFVTRNNNISPMNNNQNNYWIEEKGFQNRGRGRNNFRRQYRPKYNFDFSLKVQGLTNEIRVRDLKKAVTQRGIRPRDISWLPHRGMAFLHFTKQKKPIEETQPSVNANSVLDTLKNLTVKSENGPETNLQIEAALPIRKVHFTV